MTTSHENTRIGFIGLGLMGKSMAKHLIQNGYSVTVFNRSKKSVEELKSAGAKTAVSPAELAHNSDVVIDMVTDAPDVLEVILGKDGVITTAKPGSVVIDMSTNSPDTSIQVASKLAEKEIGFLDAPVSGGDKGAREATLAIMVGGTKDTFEKCLPILKCMGKEIVYMGKTGSGQATKLVNQVAVSIHTLATSEALLLGTAAGLNGKDLIRVLTGGAANSWNLANLGLRILQRDFEPGFKVAHIQKDLKYVVRLAEKYNIPLFGTTVAYQLFGALVADNGGEKGTQAIAQILEGLAKREIKLPS
jgi:3-hydroxyisobutyrate dehydrogenase